MNRLAAETSPYLRQHADNPVDWYPWGDEAFAARPGRGQADPPVGRVLVVPLVPRHGARVVRGPGRRRGDEPAVRQREGRPRGAARRRRDLHAGGAGDDRPRRLADDRVPRRPTAGPFFGGTYFPKDDRQGMPGFVRRAGSGRRRVARTGATSCSSSAAQLDATLIERVDRARRRRRRRPRPRRPSVLDAACRDASGEQFDARFGGFGRRAEVPAGDDPRLPAARLRARTDDPTDARDGDARRSTRWPRAGCTTRSAAASTATRSTTYWLVPHFEKMLYDQALLLARVPARLPGDRRAALPPGRRGDDRLRAARPAPRRRRLLLGRGRRLRGRRGQVLPVVARRAGARCAATTRAEVVRYFGVTAGGNFDDPHTGYSGQHPARRRPDRGPARGGAAGAARAVRSARASGSGPGSTTRCCSGGTRCSSARSPRPPPRSSRADWMDAARDERPVPARGAAARRRPAPALVAGRAGPRTSRTPRTTPRCSRRCSPWPRSTTSRWLAEARAVADELLALFADDPNVAAFFTTGDRRRVADRATQGLPGQRDAVGELARRERAAAAGGAHRRAPTYEAVGADDRSGSWPPLAGRPPDGVRLPARRARAGRSRRRSRSRSSATATTATARAAPEVVRPLAARRRCA